MFVYILKKYKVKGDIVDNVVYFVAMTGGENMQDSATQSETPQVNRFYRFMDTHHVSVSFRFIDICGVSMHLFY